MNRCYVPSDSARAGISALPLRTDAAYNAWICGLNRRAADICPLDAASFWRAVAL